MKKWFYLSNTLVFIVLFACGNSQQEKIKMIPETGDWRMEMDLGKGKILPLQFSLSQKDGNWEMIIFNAEEEILVDEIIWKNDTMIAKLPVFDSEFVLKLNSPNTFSGEWVNHYKSENYKISSSAKLEKNTRFSDLKDNFSHDFGGKYEVYFSPDTEDEGKAIGMFEQKGNKLTGTFATERGDYRHLEGNISGTKLLLSTFDGSHAFLFEAEKKDSGLIGKFYSGTHWEEDWIATKKADVALRNADSLTFLKEGYEGISFSFPNEEGEMISLSDEKYKNKAVIVQIMGSWCPNCLDETNYLSSLYKTYNNQGLEVIALAFERARTKKQALINLTRLKTKTAASYEFLLAGATREDKATELLPMLNHIMSYPTAIFIDKSGEIRRIHTGFYGPSTGQYYTNFTSETEALVKLMINE